MTRRKRLYAVLLCLALLLSLSGCGSFERRMLRAASKMEKLESWRMEADFELGLSIQLLGQSTKMEVSMTAATDTQKNPLRTRTELHTELMGQELSALSYTAADEAEESVTTWSSVDGGRTWEKNTMKKDERPALVLREDSLGLLAYLRESAAGFTEAGSEQLNGVECTRYDGSLEGETIGEIVKASGMLDELAVNGSFGEMDLTAIVDGLSGTIPVSIWLEDRSGLLVRCDMDLSEVIASVWDGVLEQMTKLEGMDSIEQLLALGLKLRPEQARVSVVFSDFDAVGEIALPESAKAA